MPAATDSLTPARWEPAGAPLPTALAAARIELHWAAQPIAAAARALIAPVSDDSHTSLIWLPLTRLLAGGVTPAGLRLALRPDDLTLAVLRASGEPTGEALPLGGRTLDEALAWTATALRMPEGTALGRPPYPMPAHAVAGGDTFSASSDGEIAARAELRRWFATAHTLLDPIARTAAGASPVRCWPHHFDLATLLPGPGAAPAAEPCTIGVGLSPGDGSYAEPYWYVTPWPYPKGPVLPELPAGGQWHREGWLGAVLTGTRNLAAARKPDGRGAAALAFIRASVAACQALLRTDADD